MTIASTPATLQQLRSQARDLLNEFDAADGLATYYALHHDPSRSALFVHRDPGGIVDGFLARCQTGFDLFRPIVTLRVRGLGDPVPDLIKAALTPGRPYLLIVPEMLAERISPHVALSERTRNRIMRLDPSRFRPEINVLVMLKREADGSPRAEVRRGERIVALAGINWRSPIFAEVFVRVEREAQGTGLGRSVTRAVAAELLRSGVTPLYTVSQDNDFSHELALDVGFVDTGAWEMMAQAVRTG